MATSPYWPFKHDIAVGQVPVLTPGGWSGIDASAVGTQGSQGYQGSGTGGGGSQGFQGPQGTNPGPQGATGFQGITGGQGWQGWQGWQGSGVQGDIGVQGGLGYQGPQGWQGSGVQGPQGNQGNQGNPGTQGPQGWQGNQGWQGSGVQGPLGSQGNQGWQGWQGPAAVGGGNFTYVTESILGASNQYISVPGLDVATDGTYYVEFRLRNLQIATSGYGYLQFNSGAFALPSHGYEMNFGSITPFQDGTGLCMRFETSALEYDVIGTMTLQLKVVGPTGRSGHIHANGFYDLNVWSVIDADFGSIASFPNITEFRFDGGVANRFASGSRVTVYKINH